MCANFESMIKEISLFFPQHSETLPHYPSPKSQKDEARFIFLDGVLF